MVSSIWRFHSNNTSDSADKLILHANASTFLDYKEVHLVTIYYLQRNVLSASSTLNRTCCGSAGGWMRVALTSL